MRGGRKRRSHRTLAAVSNLPWLLLLVVASAQVVLAHTALLTAWKGGGFGMFSTTDGGPNRRIRAFVHGETLSAEIQIPRSLEDEYARVKEFPSRRALNRFGRQLAAAIGSEFGTVSEVRLIVLKTTFDGKTWLASEREIRQQEVAISP